MSKKNKKTTFKVEVDPTKIARGHRQRRKAGPHLDRRTKRNRTRSARNRAAMKEWE